MKVRKRLREFVLWDVQDRILMATSALLILNGEHPVDDWAKRQVWRVRTRLDTWGRWRDTAWKLVNE